MAVPLGRWFKVGEVVALFVAMGCELHVSKDVVIGADGSYHVRFLINPENDGIANLSDLEDDEKIPLHQVETWERNLGIEIPKGKVN